MSVRVSVGVRLGVRVGVGVSAKKWAGARVRPPGFLRRNNPVVWHIRVESSEGTIRLESHDRCFGYSYRYGSCHVYAQYLWVTVGGHSQE